MFSNVILADGYYTYDILLPMALILLLCKLFSLLFKKVGIPQVVGMLLAGVCIGLTKFIPGVTDTFLNSDVIEGLKFIAEIGVILIMFSAGIETDVKQIKQTGVAAIVVTSLGVIVPMAFGFVVSGLFLGFDNIWRDIFYGVILTATSVSVTVATLKELGKLNTSVGTCIVSAAILDDIIGVVVLSVVLTLGKGGASGEGFLFAILNACHVELSSALNIVIVLVQVVLFFGVVFLAGFLIRKIFNWIEKKHEHNRRLPIYSLAFCFLLAYLAEKGFGIADITGAYAAGLILAGRKTSSYVNRRTDISSYLFFSPVFFAKIGITLDYASIGNAFTGTFIAFGLTYVLAGILGKLVGCGAGAKMCKYTWKDSFRCGVGMMCRAEVCLICADKGISNGIIDANIQPYIVILILATSFITPMLLKISYKEKQQLAEASNGPTIEVVPNEENNQNEPSNNENVVSLDNQDSNSTEDESSGPNENE